MNEELIKEWTKKAEEDRGGETMTRAQISIPREKIAEFCRKWKIPCRQDRLGFFQHKQTAPISSSTPSID